MTTVRARLADSEIDDRVALQQRRDFEENFFVSYSRELYNSQLTATEVAQKAATTANSTGRFATIHDGVIEWGKSGSFQAAVQTDKGPKNLEGSVVERTSIPDIQSVSTAEPVVVDWQRAVTKVSDAIRHAYGKHKPDKALRLISEIWEHLDRADELAAARTRILLGKLGKPKLAQSPEWFKDQKQQLLEQDDAEFSASPLAVSSIELLVQSVLAVLKKPDEVEAELSVGPLGRVVADWIVPQARLQWMVEATDLPWPSVKVYQLAYPAGIEISTPPNTRILHNAFDVIDSFVQLTSGD